MAAINLSESPSAAIDGYEDLKRFRQTTAAGFITPVFSGVGRPVASFNYNISDLEVSSATPRNSFRGYLQGRRPAGGQLYPRGVYNK